MDNQPFLATSYKIILLNQKSQNFIENYGNDMTLFIICHLTQGLLSMHQYWGIPRDQRIR